VGPLITQERDTMPINRHTLHKDMSLDIDGTFHAKIEVNATPDIAIDRHIHLRRDRDAGWLIYSIPSGAVEHAGDIASGDIHVQDPTICMFLDVLYHLIADPERFGKVEFRGPQASIEAA
jgi:hypothetical protein